MSEFEEAFGVPAGHTLREVASAPLRRPGAAVGWRWEHEECDARGALVAIYESWAWGGGVGRGGFVKYSPQGWVLRRSDTPPRVVAADRVGGGGATARPEAA